MYLSRIKLRDGTDRNNDFYKVFENQYKIHQSLWQLFADRSDRKRDFLYRADQTEGKPFFYVVSERRPLEDSPIWHVESKNYQPQIAKGTRLNFMLRANPTVKKFKEGSKNGFRCDVVMDAKCRLRENTSENRDLPVSELVQVESEKWLKSKEVSNGFRLDFVKADAYNQMRFYKSSRGNPIRFSTVDFEGVFSVTEPDVFIPKALFGGIGSEKGFGCGLILVKLIR